MELQELVERIQRWKQRTSGQSVGAPDDGLAGEGQEEESEEESQVQDSETASEEGEEQLSITENIVAEPVDEVYAEVSSGSILATEETEETVDEEPIDVESEEPQQPAEQEEETDDAVEGETDLSDTDLSDEESSKAG
jgi:hypothetical protein